MEILWSRIEVEESRIACHLHKQRGCQRVLLNGWSHADKQGRPYVPFLKIGECVLLCAAHSCCAALLEQTISHWPTCSSPWASHHALWCGKEP